ncbi:MAG TPA: hypothetical protein VKW77_05765, partial [Acidimicrobiales bacterium]|nr:hypothetical protein [Acidimicrobiales bacterium]
MAERTGHTVDPADERVHVPGPEDLWSESYYLDFVADTGELAGYTRLGVYPNLGVTWWTTALVGEGRPIVSSVDHHLPPPDGTPSAGGLRVRSPGFDSEYAVRDPLRSMSVRGSADAAAFEAPEDVYRTGRGQPSRIELDLTWSTDGAPYHYDVTTRYEVPCRVEGEVCVEGSRLRVAGQGQRDHSWGVRDWWAFGWCWAAARLEDGARVHWADIRSPGGRIGLGYLQQDGEVSPVESLRVDESPGREGLPERAVAVVEPTGLHLEI